MAVSVRSAAAQAIAQVLRDQGSLSSALPVWLDKVSDGDRGLLQELCFGTLRWYPRLDRLLSLLVDKPLRKKDSDIQALLLLGLYQLIHTRIPDHAAIGETVEVARAFKKPWATKLLNGVLRQFQRDREALEAQLADDPIYRDNHPAWLAGMIRKAWKTDADAIFAANDLHPPFTVRLNPAFSSRADWIADLHGQGINSSPTPFSPVGITLEKPADPRTLPLFNEGGVTVQDEAAQLAADLLELEPGMRVLDACAAPGGKTGHIFEAEPAVGSVVALDSEERRLGRVRENLARLGVEATILCGDASRPQDWWDGQAFDRILLDAPCSATGIIRRHPDIKVLRTAEDIHRLAALQASILDALWALLAPGGVLVYATCSIMPAENTRVIEAFLQRQPNAVCDSLDVPWGKAQPCGRQLLPQPDGHDGFYYARLRKPFV